MHIFYHPTPLISPVLNPEESQHCCKVLRLKTRDSILIIDGKGNSYEAEINEPHRKKTSFKIIKNISSLNKPKHHIHLAIAPTKSMDRMEWLIEKATEIGIQEISFIQTSNSERKILKTERLLKKAISAMKQSQNLFLPQINELESFKSFINKKHTGEKKYLAYVEKNNPPEHLKSLIKAKEQALILIGPEGDFDTTEIKQALDNQYISISLGANTLRTETAALVACHICTLANQ